MRDLAFVFFLVALLGFGFRRPFLFVLAYAYVDTVSPQRLSYYMLNSVPLSLIVFALAFLGWLIADNKRGLRLAPRQGLMILLLAYAAYTTANADFPVEAAHKWDWASKAMIFAIFLPLTLGTRLRIEAMLLFMTLSAAAIVIVGGIKTAASGGGYGVINLMVDNNSGLYESSTISTVAIALIPIILWLARHGTIYPPEWRVKLFAYALVFACLLMPVGTVARTGLVCIGVLAVLQLRHTKRRILYLTMLGAAGVLALALVPSGFTERMGTIKDYKSDQSAGTRLAVWAWTWEYAKDHPMGGGFDAYRANRIQFKTQNTETSGAVTNVTQELQQDAGRAYHSSYFEMLGEQGFPGLILWLLIHGIGLFRMEVLRRRYRADEARAWVSPLAVALQHAQIIYLVGSLFVGIAYQPFILMLVGVQIGFDQYLRRIGRMRSAQPFAAPIPAAA
jgi:probable O-glycosylation ligase (exosortase A-associated)